MSGRAPSLVDPGGEHLEVLSGHFGDTLGSEATSLALSDASSSTSIGPDGGSVLISDVGGSVLQGSPEAPTFLHGAGNGQNIFSALLKNHDPNPGAQALGTHDPTSADLGKGFGAFFAPDQPNQMPIGTPVGLGLAAALLLFLPSFLGEMRDPSHPS